MHREWNDFFGDAEYAKYCGEPNIFRNTYIFKCEFQYLRATILRFQDNVLSLIEQCTFKDCYSYEYPSFFKSSSSKIAIYRTCIQSLACEHSYNGIVENKDVLTINQSKLFHIGGVDMMIAFQLENFNMKDSNITYVSSPSTIFDCDTKFYSEKNFFSQNTAGGSILSGENFVCLSSSIINNVNMRIGFFKFTSMEFTDCIVKDNNCNENKIAEGQAKLTRCQIENNNGYFDPDTTDFLENVTNIDLQLNLMNPNECYHEPNNIINPITPNNNIQKNIISCNCNLNYPDMHRYGHTLSIISLTFEIK